MINYYRYGRVEERKILSHAVLNNVNKKSIIFKFVLSIIFTERRQKNTDKIENKITKMALSIFIYIKKS